MPTILIVDDSAFSRGRVVAALTPLGCRLIEAADGQEGLEACESHQPDLIITDLLMPKLDGFGMLRVLQERGSKVPVIVISADIQESSRRTCLMLGVSSFLNKPFQSQDLSALVESLLRHSAVVG